MGRKAGENLGMTYCHNLGGNQVFAYTKRQQIMADDNCLDASRKNGPVKLVRCHGMGGNQAWTYDIKVIIKFYHQKMVEIGGILSKIAFFYIGDSKISFFDWSVHEN